MDTTTDDTAPQTNDDSTPTRVSVVLKWSKRVLEFEIAIPTSTNIEDTKRNSKRNIHKFTGQTLKDIVYSLTTVPVSRQKIVVAKSKSKSTQKWWKGILKDDFDFSSTVSTHDTESKTSPIELRATLMGTAEVLESNKNNKIVFLEDMTLAEQKAEERRELMTSMGNVAAMIPALQVPPLDRQPQTSSNVPEDKDSNGDNAMAIISDFEEIRAYDRLVHGFSQLRIDGLLRHQQKQQEEQQTGEEVMSLTPPPRLLGRAVMTMGLELQRAYVNDLAVLNEDGTLVSGLDDGHVQMWKHCHRVGDVIHQPGRGFGGSNVFPGVDSVLALDNDQGSSPASFATAGRGCIRVWNSEGEELLGVPSPIPHASPTGLVRIPMGSVNTSNDGTSSNDTALCLAARFRIVRPPSRRPRLVPQDNAGRSRLAEIEAREATLNNELTRMSKRVQILYAENATNNNNNNGGNGNPTLRSVSLSTLAPTTALASWEENNTQFLATGDNQGSIILWKVEIGRSSRVTDSCSKVKEIQLVSLDNTSESRSAIVFMKYVNETKQLWVSTKEIPPTCVISVTPSSSPDCPKTYLPLRRPQGVHCIVLDAEIRDSNYPQPSSLQSSCSDGPLLFSLDGHKDVVQCILYLPNGDLVTAGGKLDATTKVWSRSQLKAIAVKKNGIAEDAAHSPPQILTEAATTNLCKDAGYIFAVELLKDFKSKGDPGDTKGETKTNNHFAIAVARYNVVKILI